ncbi:hypothetical protein B0H19DRAFT_1074282 [Mycena capillaripes]|nr:hypothetical protein B0H19DRAFT_1074282 [Mycena capillaripes]
MLAFIHTSSGFATRANVRLDLSPSRAHANDAFHAIQALELIGFFELPFPPTHVAAGNLTLRVSCGWTGRVSYLEPKEIPEYEDYSFNFPALNLGAENYSMYGKSTGVSRAVSVSAPYSWLEELIPHVLLSCTVTKRPDFDPHPHSNERVSAKIHRYETSKSIPADTKLLSTLLFINNSRVPYLQALNNGYRGSTRTKVFTEQVQILETSTGVNLSRRTGYAAQDFVHHDRGYTELERQMHSRTRRIPTKHGTFPAVLSPVALNEEKAARTHPRQWHPNASIYPPAATSSAVARAPRAPRWRERERMRARVVPASASSGAEGAAVGAAKERVEEEADAGGATVAVGDGVRVGGIDSSWKLFNEFFINHLP